MKVNLTRNSVTHVGDGATLSPYTDCSPATVIRIVSESTVDVQMDNWKITSGGEHDGSAEYEYSPNPQGQIVRLRRTKRGGWKSANGYRGGFGNRRRYYDPSF